MSPTEATTYLRRYQKWRREVRGQPLIQGGFDRASLSMAIDTLLNDHQQLTTENTRLRKELGSTTSKLRKCQIQRNGYNLELRRNLKSDRSDP